MGEDGLDIHTTGIGEWYDRVSEAFEVAGRSIQTAQYHAIMLGEAGFEEVHEETFDWPLNTWPSNRNDKLLGLWSREHMNDCLEAWSLLPLTRFLGWQPEEVQVLVAKARTSLMDTSVRASWKV